MATQKKRKNYSVSLNLLDGFVLQVSGIRETPALIQMISGSREWIELAQEIVNATPENNAGFWQKFSQTCQQNKIDPDNLKANLIPVAGALGLIVHDHLQQDYYSILGVAPSSSAEEVQKAYHRRAKSLHPDTRKNGEDDQAFVELVEGYRVLKDPALREHYDKSRQSTGLWHEHNAEKNQNRDDSGRKSRRNRYFLQLSGVVILMISVVFVFNLIYESQAINDGFYIPPEPEPIPDLNGKITEIDREIDKLEKNGLKNDLLSPDLKGKTEGIPAQKMKKKREEISAGITSPDKKQTIQSGVVVSVGKKTRSVINKNPEKNLDVEKIASSFSKDENNESIENTTGNEVFEKHIRLSGPKAQAVMSTKVKEKEDSAENHSEDHIRSRAELVVDQGTANNASKLLHKFVQEDNEMNRVTDFIRKYSDTYMEKNYSEFSRLFTKDATENGKAFSELASDYHRIFAAIENLKYQVTLHKTSFLVDQGVVRTRGIYKITWKPYDGMLQKSEGPISFEIVKQNGGYRVRKLVYGQIKPK